MQNKPEQSTAEYFAELAKRYELHKQSGGDVFDFEPVRDPPPKDQVLKKPRPGRAAAELERFFQK